jgi:hypothetical protein
MANTYTTGLKLVKPGLNDAGWGTTVNDRLTDLVDQAVVGSVDVAVTSGGTTTLPTIADGTSSDARNMTLVITGSLTSVQTATVRVPATVTGIAKLYSVTNSAGGTVTVETSGGASVAVPNGKSMLLRVTSAGVYEAVNYAVSLTLGTALPATSGGTGQSSFAVGDLLYASSTTAISKLTVGATNAVLTVAAGIPSWVTTLPVASGGTGAATLAANNVLLGNGTSAVQTVAPGASGNVLTSDGTTWQSTAPAAGYVGPTTQVFSSNGTFTIPSGITKVKVTLVGGGGGTAGAPTNGEVLAGGGGATAIKWLTSLTSGNTISVTVGSGGTASGSSGVAGGAGGNSSIASGTQSITTVTANGGAGGGVSGVGSPGSGGTATNGDLNMSGSSGTTSAIAGFSIFSTPVYSHVAGNAIGGGGGGRPGGAGASSSGVAGAAGIVIFEW